MKTAKMLDRVRELCDSQDVLPTIDAMMKIFGADRSSITGRIADLRSEGYDIKMRNGHYVVLSRPLPPEPEPVISIEQVLKNQEHEIEALRLTLERYRDAIASLYGLSTQNAPGYAQ
jgi:hypothetical protein